MKYRYFTFLIIIITIFGFAVNISAAQTLPENLSQINVNDLSDTQIRQLIQREQSSGLTDAQFIQQLQSRGMSADQAKLLQQRIVTLRGTKNTAAINDTTLSQQRKVNYINNDTLSNPEQNKNDKYNLKPKVFGADLFRNGNATFEPNLNIATPVNYILGPQDQLNVNVYGNSLANWKLTVSPEGSINIPGVGVLNVSGKTIEQATSDIKNKLSENNYAIGKGTTVQVSLGNIRSIKVIIIGQVQKPGTYTLPSLATVFNALYASGGPNDNGSFRQIEIIRNNEVIRRLDVYDFLVKGDQKNNVRLQDQDIIRVPTYRVRVDMEGEIKIPALFEVLPGETLQDIITFAGGFTDKAYTRLIKVSQISDQQRRITDVSEDDYKNYIPLRGDIYTVDSIIDRYENRVTINGAVFRPGEYELKNGLTLLQLIKQSAGLKEDAFMGAGIISRLKTDNSTETVTFNLQNIMNGSSPDVPLKREDVVYISSIFDLRDQYTVMIKGSVRNPGTFPYGDNMTVLDLIIRAGGFEEGGSSKRIEVARRVNNSDPLLKNTNVAQVFNVDVDSALNSAQTGFKLKPFDIVSVYTSLGYEKQRTVKVEGEVLYPGYYTIEKKNEKISGIIARAGGLSASADVSGGTLKRDNIAILGVDRNKSDSSELVQDRIDRLSRLKKTYKDSTSTADLQSRNDYVGIDLKSILEKPRSDIDLIMEDGDVLRIPKQEQIVRVNGQVLYPSAVVFSGGKSFMGYILNAGGFAPDALKKGAYIVYPNGTVKGTRKFLFFNNHPAVKPGSEIYVPKRPERRPVSAGEIIGLTSGLASIAAVIFGIISLNK